MPEHFIVDEQLGRFYPSIFYMSPALRFWTFPKKIFSELKERKSIGLTVIRN